MTTWYTSDTHFHHKAMPRNFRKGFMGDVGHMNHVLITCWNGEIRPNDIVYHVGDFSFGKKHEILEVIGRLNGRIRLIKGNHDHTSTWPEWLKSQFDSIERMAEVKIAGVRSTLCHYPMLSWRDSNAGTYLLHGHCHGNLPSYGRALDVGVDTRPYLPYHEDEVHEILSKRDIHHHDDHHRIKEKV